MQPFVGIAKQRIKRLFQSKQARRHGLVGPAELWEMKREFQIKFLKTMDLQPDHYILDLGCGTLRGGIPVIDYLKPGHYFGIDIREDTLTEGRKELQEAGLEDKKPQLICSTNLSQLQLDQKFDYIWAFSVLIHMTDEILGGTLTFVSKHLAEGGTFYANVNFGKHAEGNWQGFPIVYRDQKFYRRLCQENNLQLTDIGSLKQFGHNSGVAAQDEQRIFKIVKVLNS